MTVRAEKGIVLTVISIAVAMLVWSVVEVFGTFPVPKEFNPVRASEMHRLQTICSKMQIYVIDHPEFVVDGRRSLNVDKLLSANAISAPEAVFLRDHDVVFHGFDSRHPDNFAFEAVFTNAYSAWRIAMRNDGSVLRQK